MNKEIQIHYTTFENSSYLDEVEKKLFELAKETRLKAYAPYSNFLVGCAILLENGEMITGNNQENAAFPSGTCAERSAIYWASANFPKVAIKKIFVVGGPEKQPERSVPTPPCGACRQSILEYENAQNTSIEIFFAGLDGQIIKTNSIKDLLPFSFDSNYL